MIAANLKLTSISRDLRRKESRRVFTSFVGNTESETVRIIFTK
jgi:hypothetical protein